MERLADVKEGKYKIIEILKPGKYKKLCGFGIFIGDVIEVIKSAPGPLIIKKGNITCGISYGMAIDIIVEKVE